MLVSDARPLRLNQVWSGASFFHSWTTLSTGCQGISVNARQLMRNTTLTVGLNTFRRLTDALNKVPEGAPLPPPSLVWELVGCPEDATQGPCVPVAAQNLQSELTQAQLAQSTALSTMRSRKATMDRILLQIQNNTLPSLMSAIAARDSLRDAQNEFEGTVRTANRLQGWIWQAGNATWDADAPAPGARTQSTNSTSTLQLQARKASPQGSQLQHPRLLLAQRRTERKGAVVNLLFGSGRLLRNRRAPHEQFRL